MALISDLFIGKARNLWGGILRDVLLVSHNDDGSLRSDVVDGVRNGLATTSQLSQHTGDTNNPHAVTKSQVGLGLVDNTADAGKPVSTAQQTALNLKANQTALDTTNTNVGTNTTNIASNTSAIATHTTQIGYTNPGSAGSIGQFSKNVNGAVAWSVLPVFDVMDYGATADGTAHPLSERFGSLAAAQAWSPTAAALTEDIDTHAVRRAIAACKAAGGGTVAFTMRSGLGRYLCSTYTMKLPSGQPHVFAIDFDNFCVRIDKGVTLRSTAGHANSVMLFDVRGSFKPTGGVWDNWLSHWFQQTSLAGYPLYPINPVAEGDTSVTFVTPAHAGNFAADDEIYIRTGQTNSAIEDTEPDAEYNVAPSAGNAGTGVLPIRYPASKAYAQEAISATGARLGATVPVPLRYTITTSSVANPTTITTSAAHGLIIGDTVQILGHTGSTPALDGTYTITNVATSTTFTIAVNVTVAGSGGTAARVMSTGTTITSSSVANPSVITTATHGLTTGDSVTISGHVGSTPAIDGTYTVTVINSTSFSIPVNVTAGGTGGKVARILPLAVQKVTGAVVRNFKLDNQGTIEYFPSTGTGQLLSGQQIVGLEMVVGNVLLGNAMYQNCGTFRFFKGHDGIIVINSSSVQTYFAGSSGVNDMEIDNVEMFSLNALGFIHFAEGNADIRMTNFKMRAKQVVDSNALITSGSRGYRIAMDNFLLNRPSGSLINFSSNPPVDTVLIDNAVLNGGSWSLTSKNVHIGSNVRGTALNSIADTYSLRAGVFTITQWVYYNSASSILMQAVPPRWYLTGAEVWVETTFNGTSPSLKVGQYAGFAGQYLNTTSLSGAQGFYGTKVNALQSGSAFRIPEIRLTSGGSTAGKALVILTFTQVPAGNGV